MSKFTIEKIQKMKGQEKITMLTAYSCPMANILAEAGIELILVGDSLGMVFQGQENTLSVTVEEMIYHAKAVRRGAPESFVIVDMPFMSYQVNTEQTLINAGKIMKAAMDQVKGRGGGKAQFAQGGADSGEVDKVIGILKKSAGVEG